MKYVFYFILILHICKAIPCNGLMYKINKGFRITADMTGN